MKKEINRLDLTGYLLPTKDASQLYIVKNILYFEEYPTKSVNIGNQHLYLASDAPIKEGDWVIETQRSKDSDVVKITNGEYCIAPDLQKKIEFTTDSKLIANGVPAIDGNTKATVRTESAAKQNLESYKRFINNKNVKNKKNIIFAIDQAIIHQSTIEASEANFLEEFCKRYNQKDNQKVDVEKLADEYIRKSEYYDEDGASEYQNGQKVGFKDGFNQALQSNARGFEEGARAMREIYIKQGKGGNELPLLTKEQTKRDIVIECEMEGYIPISGYVNSKQIKFKDGQPILIFR